MSAALCFASSVFKTMRNVRRLIICLVAGNRLNSTDNDVSIGLLGFLALLLALFGGSLAYPRDLDGHYAAQNPELHQWFNSLANQHGQLCCSFADGRTVEDPDVDDSSGHYRVRVDGEWLDVSDEAVVTVPNKFGRAVVWPFKDHATGKTMVRCFMPGSGT